MVRNENRVKYRMISFNFKLIMISCTQTELSLTFSRVCVLAGDTGISYPITCFHSSGSCTITDMITAGTALLDG